MTSFSGRPCLDQCRDLYDAYVKGLTGGQLIRIRYADNWKEFRPSSPGDMDRLRDLYMTLWRQCPEAQAALPSLDQKGVRRGPALPLKV